MVDAFAKTPLGQIIYDMGFSRISDKSIARKHSIPIKNVRELRAKVKEAISADKKRKPVRQP